MGASYAIRLCGWIATCAAMTGWRHMAWPPYGPPRCRGTRRVRRGAGGVLAEAARGRGGARPRWGRNLDGRMHLMGSRSADSLTPGPSPLGGEGWTGAFAGLRGPGSAAVQGAGVGGVLVGAWGGRGVGSGRGAGQAHLAQPARAGQRCVSARCPQGGTQTVTTGLPRRDGEGPAMTRCHKGGTLTVLTRRPGRDGRGYVSTRCRRSGTQAAMPRRAQGGVGSLMTRCPRLGGGATVVS